MPTRDIAPIGAPCWVDLSTSDTASARAFYSALFGWTAEEAASEEFGGYFMFNRDGRPVAGCAPPQSDAGTPDAWSIYLATDDAAKTIESVTANGGQVLVPATAVADMGTMGVVTDPGGAAIGMWQPGSFAGFSVLGETGTPSWFELHARDYSPAVDFYREVFRWNTEAMSDTADFRYTVHKDGETMLAGIMDASAFLPDGVPARWVLYFGVDDTDAAVAQVAALGGTVVQPAEDTPYGRMAAVTDPTGAPFKLVGPNAAIPASGSA